MSVDGEQLTAHPHYHPDRPHFFEGGSVAGVNVPGGDYRTPFWKKALAIGGAVAGGEILGDLLGGGGRFGDYSDDNGWDGGVDNDGGW